MGYGDLGSYNANSRIPTPHMDSIASQGMRFTDAHSPSAVCTPTRYALLMGRYAWRLPSLTAGVTNGYSPLIADTNRTTIADIMTEAG
ncbi:MAG: sulfatase-like hydrolase/transferase, partial [Rhodothermaceae bacterium]|nr:sulfatase-like hydrolase/transferase [Rhodothermaceae bacterium]